MPESRIAHRTPTAKPRLRAAVTMLSPSAVACICHRRAHTSRCRSVFSARAPLPKSGDAATFQRLVTLIGRFCHRFANDLALPSPRRRRRYSSLIAVCTVFPPVETAVAQESNVQQNELSSSEKQASRIVTVSYGPSRSSCILSSREITSQVVDPSVDSTRAHGRSSPRLHA